MGTKRIGLARTQALLQQLKRELSMGFATILRIGVLKLYDSADARHIGVKIKTVDVTLATGATTTDVADFFPKNCAPLSLTVHVTTAITNNGYIAKIGTDGNDDIVATGIADGALEDLDDKVTFWLAQGSSAPADSFTAKDTLRLTTNANPTGGGAVRVTMCYLDCTHA